MIVRNLTDVLQLSYPNVQLEMFGSCVNGFETNCSDIDVCVIFPTGTKEAEDAAYRPGIEKVCIVMRSSSIFLRSELFIVNNPVCFSSSENFVRSCIGQKTS